MFSSLFAILETLNFQAVVEQKFSRLYDKIKDTIKSLFLTVATISNMTEDFSLKALVGL